ncbi:MAG: DUF2330 domain-containing protein [Fimbriimonas sp.]
MGTLLTRIAGTALALSPFVAQACCAVGPDGKPIPFQGQKNIIVWDADRGVEHFVRNASFYSRSKSLGFIAPSPSRPTLSEADAKAFEVVGSLGPPPPAISKGGPTRSAASVTVLEVKDVAGYRATVLRATDAGALTKWLQANGYESPGWMKAWVQPYVAKSWYLTAFKVLSKGGKTATGPVRMSFKTDRPFNPYWVPAANTSYSPLQLYYVSAGSERPLIGGKQAWQEPQWSSPLPERLRKDLAAHLKLPASGIPKNATVTSYFDPGFSKPGKEDLFFVAQPRRRPSVLLYVGMAGIAGAVFAVRRRTQPRA